MTLGGSLLHTSNGNWGRRKRKGNQTKKKCLSVLASSIVIFLLLYGHFTSTHPMIDLSIETINPSGLHQSQGYFGFTIKPQLNTSSFSFICNSIPLELSFLFLFPLQ